MNSTFILGATYPFQIIRKAMIGSRWCLFLSYNGKTTIPGCEKWSFRVQANSEQAEMSDADLSALEPVYCQVSKFRQYHQANGDIQFPEFVQVEKPHDSGDVSFLMEPFDDAIAKMEEGEELEKKSSIVFPAGQNGQPDIDSQLGFHIMRVIAGLANQKGGHLFIGLHDKNGTVCGIDSDLPYLSIELHGKRRYYDPSRDAFMRIIQDCVEDRLGSYARMLITPQLLLASNGAVVCRVRVRPYRREEGPIKYKERDIFQRVGSETIRILPKDREEFLLKWRSHVENLPPVAMDRDDEMYLSVCDNGDICFREKHRREAKIICRIKIPSEVMDRLVREQAHERTEEPEYRILLVFKNGTLTFLDLSILFSTIKAGQGIGTNVIQSPGLFLNGFYFKDASFLFVKTRWQRTVEGFKLFDPSVFFDKRVECDRSYSFLPSKDLDILVAHLISRSSLETFIQYRPILTRELSAGDSTYSLLHSKSDSSDFGYLAMDVLETVMTDLQMVAENGKCNLEKLTSASSFLLFWRDEDGDPMGKIIYHDPTDEELLDLQIESSGWSYEREPVIVFERKKVELPIVLPVYRPDYDCSCMVYINNSGLAMVCCRKGTNLSSHNPKEESFSLSSLIDSSNKREESDDKDMVLGLLSIWDKIFYVNPSDCLVILLLPKTEDKQVSLSSSTNQPCFLVVRIQDLQTIHLENETHNMTVNTILSGSLIDYRIISMGVLSSNDFSRGLESWISDFATNRDPRCPLLGFDTLLWIKYKWRLTSAVLWQQMNNDVETTSICTQMETRPNYKTEEQDFSTSHSNPTVEMASLPKSTTEK